MGKPAKAVKTVDAMPPLVLGLYSPGMTPLMRAGLGGIAASLRAIHLQRSPKEPWPRQGIITVTIGPGQAEVSSSGITFSWGDAPPSETLQALFDGSFRLSKLGLVDLPGTYDVTRPRGGNADALFAAEQGALKRTFLQHGKTTTKDGAAKTLTIEIDGQQQSFMAQSYKAYAHQEVWSDLALALPHRSLRLAGWAYPGAAQRHIKYPETSADYSPQQALCACFALVGCLSFLGPSSSGVLVTPEPDDLLRFAAIRPQLGAKRVVDVYVAGHVDAVLCVEVALRAVARISEYQGRGVSAVSGVLLRATPWDSKQKYRVRTLPPTLFNDAQLDTYVESIAALPTELRVTGGSKTGSAKTETDGAGFFAVTSELRAFIAENLALGRKWYCGFATAKSSDPKEARLLHRYRTGAKDLGALRAIDRKGLIAMTAHLDSAEQALVHSVHVALRQRLGAIAEECSGNTTQMYKRFENERDRWRFAFAGAKTHPQIRSALADLWSRGGPNKELQQQWQQVLPLLRPEHWQAARDLALIALASYQSERTEQAEPVTTQDSDSPDA